MTFDSQPGAKSSQWLTVGRRETHEVIISSRHVNSGFGIYNNRRWVVQGTQSTVMKNGCGLLHMALPTHIMPLI